MFLRGKIEGRIKMVEQVFSMSRNDDMAVEKLIFDENINYIHMVFNNGQGLPEHFANSNVYMTVVRGQLSIQLNEQDDHIYEAGNVLKIPEGTKMNVRNKHEATLELIVVKAPAPKA
jgi:quercetin dioxygenase-like cupin family protein